MGQSANHERAKGLDLWRQLIPAGRWHVRRMEGPLLTVQAPAGPSRTTTDRGLSPSSKGLVSRHMAAKKLGAFGVTSFGYRLDKHTGLLREFTPVGAGMTTQEKGVNLCTDSRNAYFSTSLVCQRKLFRGNWKGKGHGRLIRHRSGRECHRPSGSTNRRVP